MFKVHNNNNSSTNYQPNFKNKIKALLIDDEVISRQVITFILEGLHVEILAVENAIEAINIFHTGKSFDVILVALELTEMGGMEVIQKLRSMGVTTTIAGLTLNSVDKVMQEFREAGGDILHTLPILRATFIELLEDVDRSLG